MNTELTYLVLTALLTGCLWIPVVIGYVKYRGLLQPEDYRHAPTSELPDWVNRANRAHLNAVENFAPFAAVVVVAALVGHESNISAIAAATFFYARLAHAVLHLLGVGVMMARTLAFNFSWFAFIGFTASLLLGL